MLRLFAGLVNRLNCRTLEAMGGGEALDILDSETPDLLILDLAMPEINGFDVLRYVREIPRLDDMLIMILTARPNVMPEIEEFNIDYWVSKPIMPQDFLDFVGGVLDDSGN